MQDKIYARIDRNGKIKYLCKLLNKKAINEDYINVKVIKCFTAGLFTNNILSPFKKDLRKLSISEIVTYKLQGIL